MVGSDDLSFAKQPAVIRAAFIPLSGCLAVHLGHDVMSSCKVR